MFFRALIFTDRNKAKIIISVSNFTTFIAYSRFTNGFTKVVIGIGNGITRCSSFKRNFRTKREGFSVQKVEEVLEIVLLTLEVTRVPVIADF